MFLDVQPCDSSAILELFSSQASHFTVTKAFEPSLPSDHMLKRERVLLDVFFFVCLGLVFVFVFFIIIICLLQTNRADNDCPCGKKNRWFGEKKETEKPLKNRHHY